jgi:gentisate 1,2-dioxygenase
MSLETLNQQLKSRRFMPGWSKTTPSLWKEPRTPFPPSLWRYAEAKPALDRAGELVSTELAERRNLLLFDDADPNHYATTRTIVAAYQMLRPGEKARAHRHSPSALRLVLDAGEGVYTNVDGIELPMRPGSVLLTPGGAWHSHLNEGTADAYWIDVLDVPLVQALEPMFFEPHPDEFQPTLRRADRHDFLFDRDAIEARLAADEGGGDQPSILDLSSPAMPTVAIHMLGFGRAGGAFRMRETSNNVFAVAAGNGEVTAGPLASAFAAGDVISVPMWADTVITGQPGTRVLRVTDAPVMAMLGLFRSATGS